MDGFAEVVFVWGVSEEEFPGETAVEAGERFARAAAEVEEGRGQEEVGKGIGAGDGLGECIAFDGVDHGASSVYGWIRRWLDGFVERAGKVST